MYCNLQACWSGAIVATITTIAITNMNVGPVQVYQTCMLVDASLTHMTADLVEL